MKHIDLHIHTIKTISDHDFVFSMEALSKYVSNNHIDAIAISCLIDARICAAGVPAAEAL